MNPDGMSYLEIGGEALKNGLGNLVNATWSPAYPALIGLALFLFKPSPDWEFPLVHLVNFLVFAFALFSFTRFLKSFLDSDCDPKRQIGLMTPFYYSTFLWFTAKFMPFNFVTPDLLVVGMVFLAASFCCRVSGNTARRSDFVLLGAILGSGYYVKTAMLPAGLILLAILFFRPPNPGFARRRIALSAAMLLILAAPLVFFMSRRVGHLSTGEAARLNYLWFVDGLRPYTGWTGGTDRSLGIPEHAPRIYSENPLIIEFASPVKGTYPLWYDPSYWYSGATPRFRIRGQLKQLSKNLRLVYWEACKQMAALFLGAGVFVWLGLRSRFSLIPERHREWLFIWPVALCAMYGLVLAENRYVGGFLVLFWIAVYDLLCRRQSRRAQALVPAAVALVLLVSNVSGLRSVQPDYLAIAGALRSEGIRSGEHLASLGNALGAYYAHATGMRVVAQVVSPDEFWGANPQQLTTMKNKLAALGVRALVFTGKPKTTKLGDWHEVISPDSRFSYILLDSLEPASKAAERH